MTERELQEAIRELARYLQLLCYHTFDSRRSEPGWPDLVIVGPSGCLFRELKSERGRLTEAQTIWLSSLRTAGLDAAIWHPTDWPDTIRTQLEGIR